MDITETFATNDLRLTLLYELESLNLSVPPTAYTLGGFRRWAVSEKFPDRGLVSFIDGGVLVNMSPESIEEHNQIKTEVSRVVSTLVHDGKLGLFCSDRVLLSNQVSDLSTEPDAMFIANATRREGGVTFVPVAGRPGSSKEVIGSPDWVLEIVSPSSARKDEELLRNAYYQAGIREYWLIDALSGKINFQLLVPGDKEYVATEPVDGWYRSPTFDREFRLEREKEDDGYWLYTLQMREG